eukprot:scaffold135540_cov61-Attheya_sp.AAC.1
MQLIAQTVVNGSIVRLCSSKPCCDNGVCWFGTTVGYVELYVGSRLRRTGTNRHSIVGPSVVLPYPYRGTYSTVA